MALWKKTEKKKKKKLKMTNVRKEKRYITLSSTIGWGKTITNFMPIHLEVLKWINFLKTQTTDAYSREKNRGAE